MRGSGCRVHRWCAALPRGLACGTPQRRRLHLQTLRRNRFVAVLAVAITAFVQAAQCRNHEFDLGLFVPLHGFVDARRLAPIGRVLLVADFVRRDCGIGPAGRLARLQLVAQLVQPLQQCKAKRFVSGLVGGFHDATSLWRLFGNDIDCAAQRAHPLCANAKRVSPARAQ